MLEAALRRPVALAAPSLWTRYGIAEDLRGHLAVGVSQSGRTPEIADTLARVRDAGAATVAITNEADSPLAAAAHATIDLQVGREDAVPATKTVTAQLAAFAILADALGEPLWPAHAWEAVPRAQEELLADDAPAAAAGAAIAHARSHVQLGRGFLYAVALEGALKVAETTGIAASGFSVADFLHGPIAIAAPARSRSPTSPPGRSSATCARRPSAPAARAPRSSSSGGGGRGGSLRARAGASARAARAAGPHRPRPAAGIARDARSGRDPDRPLGLTKVTPTT